MVASVASFPPPVVPLVAVEEEAEVGAALPGQMVAARPSLVVVLGPVAQVAPAVLQDLALLAAPPLHS